MKDMIVKLDKYVFRAKNYTTYNNNRLCNLSDILTCRGIRKKKYNYGQEKPHFTCM